uniref:Vacuolar protein sorting-associated protein 29 n=1 Tax=Chromera velia CCMP2878 TaxID=1169474 RepID=A0A0G4IDH8_9ALVE|mmetsp:Transcript_17358/g.35246  ORF Transcript_17358/g.35246 Transcript_17358/m.35246 type:complete len:205 (-) Transcript_17358:136-750(-)|eukprot:Cvel_13430.t1-p1 / transcript=Cvel_13430.t1 / gene=Cvel_13430 / organism=Chromera_velia_CCMP2878 / gene_product=Vacuolar protein sorting-associated protein 29, putative / transcript_product=Vacuolar protein sorting-associated protein 29, putative / location=Cvel_scaffold916:33208-37092(-) / protein_length=204 / sequence_SO=supercontig / SO=protein_coding / is_pseudo=false
MGSNFTEFGDLVLLIGDLHVPHRAIEMPACFRDLLKTDKIRHVLCTGNVGTREGYDMLRDVSSSVHFVKGDIDLEFDFPEHKVIQIGEFKVGLIHGHQILPWGDAEALSACQRRLGCDVLVWGHTHRNSVTEMHGKFFVNPGSATGAWQPWMVGEPAPPSFMLMAVNGPTVVLYVYEEKNGKANVVMSEFSKNVEGETSGDAAQ